MSSKQAIRLDEHQDMWLAAYFVRPSVIGRRRAPAARGDREVSFRMSHKTAWPRRQYYSPKQDIQ